MDINTTSQFKLKPNHAPVKAYYETLEKFAQGKFDNEGNIRRAFEELLTKCARPFEWFLIPEYQISRTGKSPLRVDAALLDAFNLPRAYWEAKDEKDDLHAEMNKKFALGISSLRGCSEIERAEFILNIHRPATKCVLPGQNRGATREYNLNSEAILRH